MIILLLCLLLTGALWGLDPLKSIDQYVQEGWTTDNGLPENSVAAVSQTPNGYLWVATRQQLCRFNGVKFVPFSLFGNTQAGYKEITALKVDRGGILWIGTRGDGLFKYQDEVFEIFTQKNGLSGNTINCLYDDLKNNLWIGADGFLACLTEKEIIPYSQANGLPEPYIYTISEDSKGNLWVGTRGDGLYRFTNGRFSKVFNKEFDRCDVTAIKEDSPGGLWIGTNRGLVYYRGEKVELLDKTQGISGYIINDIIEDSDGNIWVGTGNGLFRIRKGWSGISTIRIDESMNGSVVSSVFEDREKSIWMATDGRGLTRLREGKIKTFSVESGLPHEYVVNMHEDRDKSLWVATMDGLTRFDKGELNREAMTVEFSDAVVGPICRDRQGNTWFGTYGSGLYKLETGGKKRLTNYTTRDGLLSDSIISLYCAGDSDVNGETLWIGTSRGLNALENGIFKNYRDDVEMLANEITCILEDNKKNLWIGTHKGLMLRKNGRFSIPGGGKLPRDVIVSSIYQDKDNNDIYWIATKGNGLIRFKNETEIFTFTIESGLYSNIIYQVFEDAGGYIWMSCDRGIFKTVKKDLDDLAAGISKNRKIDYTYYGKSDGMKSEECSRWGQHSSIKTGNGKLLFGTTKGISIIAPQDIKINTIPPAVVIDRVATNNRDVELDNEKDRLIFRNLNYIQFYFTAATLISPDRVFFKYKLENYDDAWTIVTPAQIKMAIYKKLPPGQYTFRVMAANSDGIWNEKSASFTFDFNPGFTQSLLFRIIIGFLIIAMAGVLFPAAKKYLLYRKTKNKYKDSILEPATVEQCMKKLSYVMDIEKLYRDDKISLQTLSKKVQVTPHILSQVLNERIDKNFSDFVNSFRIEEAKKMLQEADEDTSVLRVCYDVGFNSKSAFYRAFKKYTDKTPIQYQKELKKGNECTVKLK